MRISDWSSDVCSSDLWCRRADRRIDSRDARCLSGERPQLRTLPRHRPPEAEMIERGWEKKLEPLTVRVATAVRITGLSRTRIYELIQSGDLETGKEGRATETKSDMRRIGKKWVR